MSKGGISPSGRALRFWLWRLPLGVTRYSVARNTAAATEEGRRMLALAGFGLWVAAFWFVADWLHKATGMVVPLQLAGLFGLLLIWRIIGLLRRWWVHRRNLKDIAVSQQRQRQMYQMQTEAISQLRQLAARSLPSRPDGGVDVLGPFRDRPDPIRAEQQQTRREQAEEIRGQLPEESRGIPLGDRPEPLIPMPRWLRRRGLR
jgi:hypothetical protein